MKCKNTAHDDKPIRGSTRVRCAKCGDEFPCARSCEHLDCMQRRGEPPPEWADYEWSPLDPGDRRVALDSASSAAASRLHATEDPNVFDVGPDGVVSVDFGCADETGRVACSHVVIDGEHTLHLIPSGARVVLDVVDGKLVQVVETSTDVVD